MSNRARDRNAARAAANLRAATQRLAAAPPAALPAVAPQVAAALLECHDALAAPADAAAKGSAAAVALHRFKTQLSTLLAHRSPEGRFAAAVLVKAAIEPNVGGEALLAACAAPWSRALLAILSKPHADPAATKALCVCALTRIFALAASLPGLARQVVTPSLPGFITACLAAARAAPPAAALPATTVLRCFAQLLPAHAAAFRPFRAQIRAFLAPLLAQTPSSSTSPSPSPSRAAADTQAKDTHAQPLLPAELVAAARALFCLLPFCAPKAAAGDERAAALAALLAESHETASWAFRGVVEDWRPGAGSSIAAGRAPSDGVPASGRSAPELGLPPWTGIHAACERLRGLLALVGQFIDGPTEAQAATPLAAVVDLVRRVCAVTVPRSAAKSAKSSDDIRLNHQITGEERDALWAQLPAIHESALRLMETICERLGAAGKPLHHNFLELILWVFRHEGYSATLRIAAYDTAAMILEASGGGLSGERVRQMAAVIETSCNDLLPRSPAAQEDVRPETLEDAFNGTKNGDKDPRLLRIHGVSSSELSESAAGFIATVLSAVPADHIPRVLRSRLDQAAVLFNDGQLMLASVLNPLSHKVLDKPYSSLMPLLARAKPDKLEVEGLIRPRMPILPLNPSGDHTATNDEAEENGSTGAFEYNQYSEDTEEESLAPDQVGEAEEQAGEAEEQAGEAEEQAGEAEEQSAGLLDHATIIPANGNEVRDDHTEGNFDLASASEVVSSAFGAEKRVLQTDQAQQDPLAKRRRLAERSPESAEYPTANSLPEPMQESTQIKTATPPAAADEPSRKTLSREREAYEDDDEDDDNFVIPELTLEESDSASEDEGM